MNNIKTKSKYSLLLFILAIIQFSNTLGHEFAWDDKIVIQENERVQQGVSGIPELFQKRKSDLRSDQYGYRPITLVSFAIDYEIARENSGYFHFVNVLLFGIIVLLLFNVLMELFQSYSHWLAFFVALLFAVHPVHSEVVGNIKSRDEILVLLFGLLSIRFFLKFLKFDKWVYLFWVFVFFLLALLSKENAIVFLPIYFLCAIFLGKVNGKIVLKSLVFLLPALVAVFFIYNYASSSEIGMEETAGLGAYHESHILGNVFFTEDGLFQKMINASHLILLYFKDFFLPFDLAYYHGYGDLTSLGGSWLGILLLGVVLLLFVGVIHQFKRFPIISLGMLFFLFSISIYLHIVLALPDTRADRFLFMGSVGLCISFVGILVRLFKLNLLKTELKKEELSFSKLPNFFKVTILLVTVVFSFLTFQRNKVWENDTVLVSSDMEKLEGSARPNYYHASNLFKKFKDGKLSKKMEQEMVHHFERSIEISDSIYYGRIELAGYYLETKQIEKALPILRKSIQIFPNQSDPRFYFGIASMEMNQLDSAIVHLKKSAELAPNNYDSYYLLAMVYAKAQNYDSAEKVVHGLIEKFPSNRKDNLGLLGQICFDKNEMDKSVKYTLESIDYGADPYTAYATIIGRYQIKGITEKADYYYREALKKGIMTVP